VEESRRNPAESSAVHTGVCRVPDSRPSPYRRHRGPLDGGPLHRKIRPPGASRRRATDIHVTLLPYRYQPRRHNTARRTYHHRYTRRGERERERGEQEPVRRSGEEEKSSSILVTNRFDTFLPPFVSNVAYARWTERDESRANGFPPLAPAIARVRSVVSVIRSFAETRFLSPDSPDGEDGRCLFVLLSLASAG
jgi:hypothetical protein